MRLAVVANKQLKDELCLTGIDKNCTIEWFDNPSNVTVDFNGVIDLLFEEENHDITILQRFLPTPVIINSVCKTIAELGAPFVRINGWPGFLNRNIAEVACPAGTDISQFEKILTAFNKRPQWVPDIKGFVSLRVLSMIINEAYFALDEKVSTKSEIDTAMKLGTNYPYGPFEWSEKIGLEKIANLLFALSKNEKRYTPSELLIKELSQR